MREPPAASRHTVLQLLLPAFPAWNFFCRAYLELISARLRRRPPSLVTFECAFAPDPPAPACPVPFSPSPPGKYTADLVPLRTVIKFPKQFGREVKPSHFPPPAPRRQAPLKPYSPAEVRLSGPFEVLLALGPAASSEASRSILRVPGRPRRLRQPLAPARLVLEHEPRSPEGGLPRPPAAPAACKPHCSACSLLPGSH